MNAVLVAVVVALVAMSFGLSFRYHVRKMDTEVREIA